jgi:hypothetical protein
LAAAAGAVVGAAAAGAAGLAASVGLPASAGFAGSAGLAGALGAAGAQAASSPTPTTLIVPVKNARRDTPGDVAMGWLLPEQRQRRSSTGKPIFADRRRLVIPLLVGGVRL